MLWYLLIESRNVSTLMWSRPHLIRQLADQNQVYNSYLVEILSNRGAVAIPQQRHSIPTPLMTVIERVPFAGITTKVSVRVGHSAAMASIHSKFDGSNLRHQSSHRQNHQPIPIQYCRVDWDNRRPLSR